MKLNLLFVCSANKDRSATAEFYFSNKYPRHSFRSAGTNQKICFQLGTHLIEHEDLLWADKIFVMESRHRKIIQDLFRDKFSDKIIVLNIPDYFIFNQQELIDILDEKVKLDF